MPRLQNLQLTHPELIEKWKLQLQGMAADTDFSTHYGLTVRSNHLSSGHLSSANQRVNGNGCGAEAAAPLNGAQNLSTNGGVQFSATFSGDSKLNGGNAAVGNAIAGAGSASAAKEAVSSGSSDTSSTSQQNNWSIEEQYKQVRQVSPEENSDGLEGPEGKFLKNLDKVCVK